MEPWPVAHVIPIAMSLPPGDLRIASYVSCMEMPRYGVTCSVNHLANVNDANSRPAWHDARAPGPFAQSESVRLPKAPPPRHQRWAFAIMAVSLDADNELCGSDYPVNDLCRSRRACWNASPATAPPAHGRQERSP